MCSDSGTVTQVGESGLDAGVLARWLDANDAPGGGEEPQLTQLKGGSQNTLYLIERGPSAAPARMVLRMPGARADAARIDGLLREIRLVRALSGTDVPHAALIAADETGDVLGMPFYVMQAIDGLEPDGRRVAVSVRHRPRRPPRPGVRIRRRRGQAGPGGLARARTRRLRPPGRIPRAAGRSLAGVSWTPTRSASCPAWTRPPTGCAATVRRTTRRASCTATTSSPT